MRGILGAGRPAGARARERNRVGGACTIDEVWPGFGSRPGRRGVVPPAGDRRARPGRHGFRWTPAGRAVRPVRRRTSIQLWDDDARCEEEIGRLAPGDLEGWRRDDDTKRLLRDALRPGREATSGSGPADREEIEERLGGDAEARKLLFEWSMVEYVERFLSDERLQIAYLGQGVIGTNASPHDAGTASIHFHHASGRLGGRRGCGATSRGGWGWSRSSSATSPARPARWSRPSVPVARIVPGRGVELEGGERIDAPFVVSNADPRPRSDCSATRPTRPGEPGSRRSR